MGALLFFPLKAHTLYGPKYANANYPTLIKKKVGLLPWLCRGVLVMRPPSACGSVQWNPGSMRAAPGSA